MIALFSCSNRFLSLLICIFLNILFQATPFLLAKSIFCWTKSEIWSNDFKLLNKHEPNGVKSSPFKKRPLLFGNKRILCIHRYQLTATDFNMKREKNIQGQNKKSCNLIMYLQHRLMPSFIFKEYYIHAST